MGVRGAAGAAALVFCGIGNCTPVGVSTAGLIGRGLAGLRSGGAELVAGNGGSSGVTGLRAGGAVGISFDGNTRGADSTGARPLIVVGFEEGYRAGAAGARGIVVFGMVVVVSGRATPFAGSRLGLPGTIVVAPAGSG